MKKLNILLAVTDHLAASWKKLIGDTKEFFKNNQWDFKGERRTYSPKAETIDEPGKRSNKLIVSTVKEKLNYIEENSGPFIDALFSQEKTNSMGLAKAVLEVDGLVLGEFSSLELLRIKSLLENATFKEMYENIPVRDDKEIWKATTNTDYLGREVFENDIVEGTEKTTVKESYILLDPNIGKGDKYTPQIGTKNTTMELGDYTHQKFSGELTHVERAYILGRRTKLITAVVAALKTANDVEAIPSEMTAAKLFDYLHRGK